MLLKVFKRSFLKCYKTVLVICASAPLASLILSLSLRFLVMDSKDGELSDIVFTATILSTAIMLLIIFGALIAAAIVVLTSISKDFCTDEAYLTLTLPVKSKDHILGRLLSTACFYLIISASALLSAFIISLLAGDYYPDFGFSERYFSFMGVYVLKDKTIWNMLFRLEEIVNAIIWFVTVFMIYFTLVNLFKNSKGGKKVLLIIVLIFALNVFTSVYEGITLNLLYEVYGYDGTTTYGIQPAVLIYQVIIALIGFAFYRISKRLLDGGINVE